MVSKLGFSGHESFICKQFWLKKVYDFSASGGRFQEDDAVISLGVGKNMVSSLRYWGKAFNILNDQDQISAFGEFLFGQNGRDPYLEDIGTLWLLHYQLLKTNKASIYHLLFNEFRKERNDFTKDQLHGFLKRKCLEVGGTPYNINTINTDINVCFRNYVKPHKDDKIEIEDDFSGIMIDLDLIKTYKQKTDGGVITRYKIDPQDRLDLPADIVLYTILDLYEGQHTISFRELISGANSPGAAFVLSTDSLYQKIQSVTKKHRSVVFTETAGEQVLQLKGNLDKQQILNEYYEG